MNKITIEGVVDTTVKEFSGDKDGKGWKIYTMTIKEEDGKTTNKHKLTTFDDAVGEDMDNLKQGDNVTVYGSQRNGAYKDKKTDTWVNTSEVVVHHINKGWGDATADTKPTKRAATLSAEAQTTNWNVPAHTTKDIPQDNTGGDLPF